MGNIHLIPTDNEQHSIVLINTGLLLIQTPSKEYGGTKLNIHITNSEQINEGDWTVWKNQLFKVDSNNAYSYTNNVTLAYAIKYLKKIILTIDADLIKDGVQAIDDEFLEWFVKNPSCEFVEVKDIRTIPALQLGSPNGHLMYKIIIPQEDLTKEEEDTFFVNHVCGTQEESKPETLEEVTKIFINKYYSGEGYERDIEEAIKFGAKWQQENMPIHILDVDNTKVLIQEGVVVVEKNDKTSRSYSEEVLKEAFKVNYTPFSATNIGDFDKDWDKWFKQFKKK